MGLLVALDDNKQAAGELFWDDGDSRGVLPEIVHVLFIWLIYICPFRLLNCIIFFVSHTDTVETGKHIHYLFSVSSVCFLFLPHKFIFTIQFSPYPVWNWICWSIALSQISMFPFSPSQIHIYRPVQSLSCVELNLLKHCWQGSLGGSD